MCSEAVVGGDMPVVKVRPEWAVVTESLDAWRHRATRWAWGVLVVTAVAGAPVVSAAPGVEPGCSSGLVGAMTVLPDGKTFEVCEGNSWRPVGSPFNPNDRWLSYGHGVTLHGQGRRNPEILSGRWTGAPLDSSSACGVQQAPVTDSGVGTPQVASGKPGQVLNFEVLPVAFTITLTGNCLWERAS
jgi:hypothetical protein